jgi:hypothetical protein
MALIQTKKSGGLLGGIGKVLGLAGTFIPGMQWASALGMGMSGLDSIIRGDSDAMSQVFGQEFWQNALKGGWQNPASGNPAALDQGMMDEAKKNKLLAQDYPV